MSRRRNKQYEPNENRNLKHRPYGTKGSGYSGTDKSWIYKVEKKSARYKGKQEIRREIDELIDEWQDTHRLEEIEIFGGDPKEYVRLSEWFLNHFNQPFVYRWIGY